jgi:hypothetical protein
MESSSKYPAVIIPFTTANPEVDLEDVSFVPMHDLDAEVQALCEWSTFSRHASLIFSP